VTTQAGDFFANPLPEAEVITMGLILHDWDLQDSGRMPNEPSFMDDFIRRPNQARGPRRPRIL
jgi:O-methyltransferase domain